MARARRSPGAAVNPGLRSLPDLRQQIASKVCKSRRLESSLDNQSLGPLKLMAMITPETGASQLYDNQSRDIQRIPRLRVQPQNSFGTRTAKLIESFSYGLCRASHSWSTAFRAIITRSTIGPTRSCSNASSCRRTARADCRGSESSTSPSRGRFAALHAVGLLGGEPDGRGAVGVRFDSGRGIALAAGPRIALRRGTERVIRHRP